jgi:adenylate kinase
MVVVLLGPPGVGKGTQGVLLAEALEWERLVTGDLLRAARRDGTELGRKAQAFMDAGDLVPDGLIIQLVRERLEELPAEKGVILDGFPRTVPQAEALARSLAEVGRRVDSVVLLEAPDDVLVKRLSGRRSCPKCGRVYNVHFDPPKRDGLCDHCGTALDHRKDDAPETVRHRLEVYRELTEPLVAHYERGSVPVFRENGDRDLEAVRQSLWDRIAAGVADRRGGAG